MIDWSLDTSTFVPWDDGHTPETRPRDTPGLRVYPDYHQSSRTFVATQQVTSNQLANEVYAFTIGQPNPSWGSYVSMEDIQQYWKRNEEEEPQDEGNDDVQSLALRAAALFIQNALLVTEQGNVRYPSSSPCWTDQDTNRSHGVAVWGLAARTDSQVAYHVDYAEWLRYRDGVTVLPALAGTWHCTQGIINGGEFRVHTDGLEHYQRHGYKGALAPLGATDGPGWIRIPYGYNQMIFTAGHLPHLSTRVESICPPELQRVIVGFNVFLKDVGPAVQEAPEHSAQFRISVLRLQQQQRQLRMFRENARLSNCLVRAKREKVKKDFLLSQAKMDDELRLCLRREGSCWSEALVERLFQEMCSPDRWPCNRDDVRAHLQLRLKEGSFLTTDDHVSVKELRNDSLIRLR